MLGIPDRRQVELAVPSADAAHEAGEEAEEGVERLLGVAGLALRPREDGGQDGGALHDDLRHVETELGLQRGQPLQAVLTAVTVSPVMAVMVNPPVKKITLVTSPVTKSSLGKHFHQ